MSSNELKNGCDSNQDNSVKLGIIRNNTKIRDILGELNKILALSAVVATVLSLLSSLIAAQDYIKAEKLPVSVYSVFMQIMPILLPKAGIIVFLLAILFIMTIYFIFVDSETSEFFLTKNIKLNSNLFPVVRRLVSVLNQFPIVPKLVSILNKFPTIPKLVFISSVFFIGYGFLLIIVYLKILVLSNQTIFSLIVIIFVILAVGLLILYFIKFYDISESLVIKLLVFIPFQYFILAGIISLVFSSFITNNNDGFKFFIKFIIIYTVFDIFVGYLHDRTIKNFSYREIIFYGIAGTIVLLTILIFLNFEAFITRLVGSFLEVRVYNSQCVMLYQKSDLGNDNKRIQENSSPDSYNLYKINGSSELRIPLQADGMFYVGQCEKDNENKCAFGQFSDIYIVPVSSVASIRACPKLPENTKSNSAVAR